MEYRDRSRQSLLFDIASYRIQGPSRRSFEVSAMSLRPGTIEGRTSRSGATSFGPDPIIASNPPLNRASTSDRRPPVRAAAAAALDYDGDEAGI